MIGGLGNSKNYVGEFDFRLDEKVGKWQTGKPFILMQARNTVRNKTNLCVFN